MKFKGNKNSINDTINPEAFLEATFRGEKRISGGTHHRLPKFDLIKPNIQRDPIDFIYNIMGADDERSKIMELLLIAADLRSLVKRDKVAYSCGDQLNVILRNKIQPIKNESFKPAKDQKYVLVYNMKDSAQYLNVSEKLKLFSKAGNKFILVGMHSGLASEQISTAEFQLKELAQKYNAQSTIVDLKTPHCIQPLKQMIEQPCKDIQEKYDQEKNDLAFPNTIAKQPIYFTLFEAQKSRRNWRIFGIVLAAIVFTPLSLFATVPLFFWAQKQNPIKELVVTKEKYKEVKLKREDWYKEIPSALNKADRRESNRSKPKKVKDDVNFDDKKLHFYVDRAQYKRFKLFEENDLEYLKENVTLGEIKQSKEESLAIMRGLKLTI